MNDCATFFDQIAELRAGELDDEGQTSLFAHLAACRDCRDLLQFHTDLSQAGEDFTDVEDGALAGVRARVLEYIRSDEARRLPAAPARSVRITWRWLGAAAVLLLAVAGFAIGRLTVGAGAEDGDAMMALLETSARDHLRLEDVEDSPNIVSNVAVRRAGDGAVAMSFDVTRHLEIVRPLSDPLVTEVLVHAMLDQSSTGSRLRAVSVAAAADDSKVEEALLFSMLSDSELAVRMRALEILAERPLSGAVEHGLMQVLRNDESMQMRLLAVEVLGSGGPEGRRILEGFSESTEAVEPAIAERLASLTRS